MEPVTLLSKKVPPLALALLLAESFSFFGAQLDMHILARLTGACCGGVATWYWRTELVRSRRVACLMFGWCAGIGFSPILDWAITTRLTSLPVTPFLVFGSGFVVGLACVRFLEQVADNPLGLMERFKRLARRQPTKDFPND